MSDPAHQPPLIDVLARCVRGLEWVCAAEIDQSVPGATSIRLARREVTFAVERATPALHGLRTVDDVLIVVGRTPAGGDGQAAAAELAGRLAGLPWGETVTRLSRVPAAPVIDVVAAVEGRRYSRFTVENALGPLLAGQTGGHYLRRTKDGREPGDPDLTARVFVRGDTAEAAVRLTATPLHRRAYKLEAGPGTLHPPVAAALARLAALDPGEAMLDPFCGDGTIVIEAALACPGLQVSGSDTDPNRLAVARRNADRAGVGVALRVADAGRLDGETDAVVTNPPWDVTVEATGALGRDLAAFWQRLPGVLGAGGRLVAVTADELQAPETLRRQGFGLELGAQVRLAGRLSHLVLAAAPGQSPPRLPAGATAWRERAIAEGVVTATGF